MIRPLFLAATLFISSFDTGTAQEVLEGTWKLVSWTRVDSATGEKSATQGDNPQGYIMYGRDGRMMVLITRNDRPKPENVEKTTDEQRRQLFSSMLAYAGTYKFDGKTIEHNIDISWNEIWSGTKQIRDVKKDGDRLIYTTRPAPSSVDGRISVSTLIWEKLK